MKKVPTIFMRNETNRRRVTYLANPECMWVFKGEGVATRKWDGTCVMFDGEKWWGRREVKAGKAEPRNFLAVQDDPITGNVVGWEPIEQTGWIKHFEQALAHQSVALLFLPAIEPGTYELVGPKVNGNPEGYEEHRLERHGNVVLDDCPRHYYDLREWMKTYYGEGVVWHHPDGRMAKIKKRDFPVEEL